MELSTMGGRRLTSQQLQQLQQQQQQQQQQQFQQQQNQAQFATQSLNPFHQPYPSYQFNPDDQPAAMLFQHQQTHPHPAQSLPPAGPGLTNSMHHHRTAPRFHASRHRKDSLGKAGGGKFLYPPGSPSMGFNENIYHQQQTTTANSGGGAMITNNSSNSSLLSGGGGNLKHNRYPESDPDIIEVYLEDDPINLKEAVRDGKEIKWRNNIVATMERYEPAPSMANNAATLPSSYLHHHQHHHQHQNSASSTDSSLNPEYSYAYCEPIVLKQQQQGAPGQQLHPSQIPQIHKLSSSVSSNALSKLPSTNSLRALLSKSFRKSSLSAANSASGGRGANSEAVTAPSTEKHTFTTRYGTKENIYEDVGAGSSLGTLMGAAKAGASNNMNSSSMQSFESINKFNIHDELRHVQSQHDRIIGELNLSVETLIMPTKDEQDAIEERLNEIHCAQYHDEMSQDDCIAAGSSNTAMIQMQERLSPTTSQPNSGDVDSGISGSSSSGASYSSSMLYRTTAMYTSNNSSGSSKTVTINDNAEGSGSGMSMMAGSSSIRSSCGSNSGCGLAGPTGYSTTCGGANCSRLASNVVIPNSNKLSCCFYSDKLNSRSSKSSPDHSDMLGDKSSFWNKLGKLKISGVFGNGANSSNSSSNSSSTSSCSTGGPHFHQPTHLHHHPHLQSHHHHNHTLLSHPHQLPGMNQSVPTTTTNTATIARSNEAEQRQHHLHHHHLFHHHHHHHQLQQQQHQHQQSQPQQEQPTTIEPWWKTPPSDPVEPCCGGHSCCSAVEYQIPCEILATIPPHQQHFHPHPHPPPLPPPPLIHGACGGTNGRPPLPQPPLQTQIELEENDDDDDDDDGDAGNGTNRTPAAEAENRNVDAKQEPVQQPSQ
ncbi:probable serine/threonine-protein kinase yakA [Uranotaenia lowii]|uniref:probable serine/threonine-protein kinase yakA n=1 Tax=Uranotaenia lowii TaxID=190385 RepID=UPI0024789061|nr:probable serine/threonine-protein kinase yakA [Uranotaenia lowii]